jgi:hypothetical protein
MILIFVCLLGNMNRPGKLEASFLERMEQWQDQAGANEILKRASAFFAAELDGRHSK